MAEDCEERKRWAWKLEFFLALAANSIGFQTVALFPYYCYRNGGAAFLIPYLIAVVFYALPFLYFEVSLGRYVSKGIVGVWKKTSPVFKGVGFGMFLRAVLYSLVHVMLMVYTVFHLSQSFSDDTSRDGYLSQSSPDETNWVGNFSWEPISNIRKDILVQTSGLLEQGVLRGSFVGILAICWLVICLCACGGIFIIGKVFYLTVFLPVLLLLIVMIRGLTLAGATTGLQYLFHPNFERLRNYTAWYDAFYIVTIQISVGIGGYITIGSYGRPKDKIFIRTVLVVIFFVIMNLLAGMTVFSYLGFLAWSTNKSMDMVATAGLGILSPVVQAFQQLPSSMVWILMFFIMLIMLLFNNQLIIVETIVTALLDETLPFRLPVPEIVRRFKRPIISATLCFVSFLIGLIFCLQGGTWTMTWLDIYLALGLFVSNFLEISGIVLISLLTCNWKMMSRIIGFKRESRQATTYTGITATTSRVDAVIREIVNLIFWVLWCGILPIFSLVLFVATLVHYRTPAGRNFEPYPVGVEAVGIIISVLLFLPIPAYAVYYIIRRISQPRGNAKMLQFIFGPQEDVGHDGNAPEGNESLPLTEAPPKTLE